MKNLKQVNRLRMLNKTVATVLLFGMVFVAMNVPMGPFMGFVGYPLALLATLLGGAAMDRRLREDTQLRTAMVFEFPCTSRAHTGQGTEHDLAA